MTKIIDKQTETTRLYVAPVCGGYDLFRWTLQGETWTIEWGWTRALCTGKGKLTPRTLAAMERNAGKALDRDGRKGKLVWTGKVDGPRCFVGGVRFAEHDEPKTWTRDPRTLKAMPIAA